ncbi:MAG TPA: hypothetical protein PKN47_21550 [Nitrospira sp.]|nr:hypothetical protein [Nitrospira sp.]HNP84061.1 hypothetical protein [Nitrospira sp.]
MKQAKVLNYKKLRQPISWGWGIRALIRVGLRILIACLPLLPFIALATPFLLPETPHLRVKYTYTGSSARPIYRECDYLGVHGWVHLWGPDCPIVRFMEDSHKTDKPRLSS